MRKQLEWIETRVLPRGWADVVRQIALFAGAYALYQAVRGLVDVGSGYKPFGDATKIINLERVLDPCSSSRASRLGPRASTG